MSEQPASTTPEVTNPTETAPQATPSQVQPPTPPPPTATDHLRALMAKEKEVRALQERVQKERAEVESLRGLKQKAKEKPLEALRELGIEYEGLVKQVAKGERPDPIAPVQEEILSLRQQLQELRQREEEAERQVAVSKFQEGIRNFVAESPDLVLTKQMDDGHELVSAIIQNHYQATGEWVSEADAGRQVEAYLSGLVEKALKVDSIRQKYGLQQPPQAPTLSNRDASEVTARKDELSSDDLHALAVRRLKSGGWK